MTAILRRAHGREYPREVFLADLRRAGQSVEEAEAAWAMLRALQRRTDSGLLPVRLVFAAGTPRDDPAVASARRLEERLVGYLLDHRDRYTREALSDRLVAADYQAAAVEAAWIAQEVHEEEARRNETARRCGDMRQGRFVALLAAIHVGVFAVFAVWMLSILALLPAIIGIVLLVAGLAGSFFLGAMSALGAPSLGRSNVVVALAATLALPLIYMVGLMGVCIAVTMGIDRAL